MITPIHRGAGGEMATLAQAEKAIVAAIKANTIAAKVALIAGASQALGGGLAKQTAIKFP